MPLAVAGWADGPHAGWGIGSHARFGCCPVDCKRPCSRPDSLGCQKLMRPYRAQGLSDQSHVPVLQSGQAKKQASSNCRKPPRKSKAIACVELLIELMK